MDNLTIQILAKAREYVRKNTPWTPAEDPEDLIGQLGLAIRYNAEKAVKRLRENKFIKNFDAYSNTPMFVDDLGASIIDIERKNGFKNWDGEPTIEDRENVEYFLGKVGDVISDQIKYSTRYVKAAATGKPVETDFKTKWYQKKGAVQDKAVPLILGLVGAKVASDAGKKLGEKIGNEQLKKLATEAGTKKANELLNAAKNTGIAGKVEEIGALTGNINNVIQKAKSAGISEVAIEKAIASGQTAKGIQDNLVGLIETFQKENIQPPKPISTEDNTQNYILIGLGILVLFILLKSE